MKFGPVVVFLALCACGPAPDSGQRFDLECSGNSGSYSFSDRYSIDLDRRLVSTNGKETHPIRSVTDTEIVVTKPTPFTKEDVFRWTLNRLTFSARLEMIGDKPDDDPVITQCVKRAYTPF